MKKLVILGNSPAAVTVIDAIIEKKADFEVTLINHEGSYPYRRDLFMAMLAKKVSTEDIFCHERKFYKANNVSVINDLPVSRINLKTRKIYTEQKKQFDFDYLILAELPEGTKLSDIKGANKEGIYSLRKIHYVDKIIKEMPFFETVVIQSDSFAGLQQAEMFAKAGKEVYLVVPSSSPFGRIADESLQSQLREKLAEKNLFIVEGNTIEEVLGDNQVKAVRLSSGKVLAADLVVLGELDEDLKMISEFEPQLQDGHLLVDANHRTNIENVFAVDALSSSHSNQWWSDFADSKCLSQEGQAVAAALLENECEKQSFVVEQSFSLGDVTLDFVFRSDDLDSKQQAWFTDSNRSGLIEAYGYEGQLYAAYLINASGKKEAIKEFILNGVSTDSVGDTLQWFSADQQADDSEAPAPIPESSETAEPIEKAGG